MSSRRHLKDKEAKQLLRDFIGQYPSSEHALRSAKTLEELAVDDNSIFIVDGQPLILRSHIGLIPSLKFEEMVKSLPKVVVDMGAVPHVVNGAQIMRPGIRELRGDFSKGDLVAVIDERFGKPIALGLAEMDSTSIRSVKKGKMVLNVHHVGDKFWSSFMGQMRS